MEYSGVGLRSKDKSSDEGESYDMNRQGVHVNDDEENVTEKQPKKKFLLGAQCIMPGYDKELLEKLKNRRV
ncbi:conserved Plasmodium protein, unknown function [Plasmodium malariae]|nr:conserved Plasmodium protein, unknown function [Plasmodium malariae]